MATRSANLLQPLCVSEKRELVEFGVEMQAELEALLDGLWADHVDRRARNRLDGEGRGLEVQLAGRDARRVKDVVNQIEQQEAGVLRLLDVARDAVGHRLVGGGGELPHVERTRDASRERLLACGCVWARGGLDATQTLQVSAC